MLARLSGRTHEVLTGVALRQRRRAMVSAVETTRVRFAPMSDADIDWYVASGEPRGKAGGYAIQGLASRFVDRIDGGRTRTSSGSAGDARCGNCYAAWNVGPRTSSCGPGLGSHPELPSPEPLDPGRQSDFRNLIRSLFLNERQRC